MRCASRRFWQRRLPSTSLNKKVLQNFFRQPSHGFRFWLKEDRATLLLPLLRCFCCTSFSPHQADASPSSLRVQASSAQSEEVLECQGGGCSTSYGLWHCAASPRAHPQMHTCNMHALSETRQSFCLGLSPPGQDRKFCRVCRIRILLPVRKRLVFLFRRRWFDWNFS